MQAPVKLGTKIWVNWRWNQKPLAWSLSAKDAYVCPKHGIPHHTSKELKYHHNNGCGIQLAHNISLQHLILVVWYAGSILSTRHKRPTVWSPHRKLLFICFPRTISTHVPVSAIVSASKMIRMAPGMSKGGWRLLKATMQPCSVGHSKGYWCAWLCCGCGGRR